MSNRFFYFSVWAMLLLLVHSGVQFAFDIPLPAVEMLLVVVDVRLQAVRADGFPSFLVPYVASNG